MSPQPKTSTKAFASALILLLLGGCATDTMRQDGSAKTARNEVEMVRLSHSVETSDETGLSKTDRADMARFLADIQAGYGDTVSLVAGAGVSESARAAISDVVMRRGLRLSAPPASIGSMPESGEAVLVVDRYVVTPPQCPNTVMHASRNYANAPSPQHGCANVINLGQMVADPRHLLAGTGDHSPVTEKATQGIRLWREDEPAFVEPRNIGQGATSFGESGGGGGGG